MNNEEQRRLEEFRRAMQFDGEPEPVAPEPQYRSFEEFYERAMTRNPGTDLDQEFHLLYQQFMGEFDDPQKFQQPCVNQDHELMLRELKDGGKVTIERCAHGLPKIACNRCYFPRD